VKHLSLPSYRARSGHDDGPARRVRDPLRAKVDRWPAHMGAPMVAAVRRGLRAWQTGLVTSPPTLSRLPWVWFTAWLLVGVGYALSLVGIASIGLFVLPLPVLATVLLVRRQRAASGLPGLISGLAFPLLYVAYLNRAGPGTICATMECNDEWSPWPWLAVGVILLVLGVAAFVGLQRRANLRS
jgi:hypothetical protein